jgi:hypothetical protein
MMTIQTRAMGVTRKRPKVPSIEMQQMNHLKKSISPHIHLHRAAQ